MPFEGQCVYQGVAIDIEQKKGSYRSGVSPDGVAWRSKMPAAYGEVRDTVGADGDAVDVFVGDNPFASHVWVVQAKLPGSKAFDETKSMLGFDTREEAVRAFRDAYNKPGFLLGVTRWPFGAWREAMLRPKVARGQMTEPLAKAVVRVNAHWRHGKPVQAYTYHRPDPIPEVTEGRTRLYRATSSPAVWHGGHLTERREDAVAYTDNPGFGGARVYAYDVDPSHALDARRGLRPLAAAWLAAVSAMDEDDRDRATRGYEPEDDEATGLTARDVVAAWRRDGYEHVFQVLERVRGVEDALIGHGHKWIKFEDDFPEGSVTWKHLGDDPIEPVSRTPMDTRPLAKGSPVVMLVVDLLKAEQLGLFGPRPTAPVQVKAHERMTAGGVVMVSPHVRHVTPADAFRMRAHELRAHADSGHPTAHVAQAEIDRREAKRKAKEAPADAVPVHRNDAPDRDPVPAAVDAGEPVAPPVVAEGVGDLPAPEPAPAPTPEPAPAKPDDTPIMGAKPPPPGASKELRDAWKKLKDAQRASLKSADARGALPMGSSRARVTTANANWARNAEYRDKVLEHYEKLYAAETAPTTGQEQAGPGTAPRPVVAPEPTPAPEPEPDPDPEPEPNDPDEDLTTSPVDTEMRGTGTITDAGEVLWGARKHKWKRGERIDVSNLEQVEDLGDDVAGKAVNKAAVVGPHDHARDQGLGSTPGASMLKSKIIAAIAPSAGSSRQDRAAYVQGADWLKHELDKVHTAEDVAQFLKEWRLMSEGKQVGEETYSVAELLDLLKPHLDAHEAEYGDAYGGGGSAFVEDMRHKTTRTTTYAGKEFTHTQGTSVRIPHEVLKAAGFATEIVRTAHLDEHGRAKLKFTRPIVGANPYLRYLYGLAGFDSHDPPDTKSVKANRLVRILQGKGAWWENDVPTARHLDKHNDWSSLLGEKTEEKPEAGEPKRKAWERSFTGVARKGGAPVPANVDGDTLRETFGFRGVQYGNWVQQEARTEHLAHAHGAMLDLADLMGIPPKAIAHGGKLGLAFGARGNGRAAAHYEADTTTINLTHTNGAGTFAHEWGHFFDHQLAGGGTTTSLNKQGRGVTAPRFVSAGHHDEVHGEVATAFQKVMHAIEWGGVDPAFVDLERRRAEYNAKVADARKGRDYNYGQNMLSERAALDRDLKAYHRANPHAKRSKFHADAQTLGDYWGSPHEMFARAFESYCEDKLAEGGRENTYLVSGTTTKYKMAVKRGRSVHVDLEPYPHGPERATIGAAIHELVQAMGRHESLQKALARVMLVVRIA